MSYGSNLWFPYVNWGLFLQKQGDFPGAEHKYREATRIAPTSALAWNNLVLH